MFKKVVYILVVVFCIATTFFITSWVFSGERDGFLKRIERIVSNTARLEDLQRSSLAEIGGLERSLEDSRREVEKLRTDNKELRKQFGVIEAANRDIETIIRSSRTGIDRLEEILRAIEKIFTVEGY